MADDRLQELERAWQASGAFEDEVAYLRERVRVGDLEVQLDSEQLGDYAKWAVVLTPEGFAQRLPQRVVLFLPGSRHGTVEQQRQALATPSAVVRVGVEFQALGATGTSILSLGRASNNDVVLPHSTVSRFHAYLTFKEGGVSCSQAGSQCYVSVDGGEVSIHFPKPVSKDSWIQLGGLLVRVCSPAVLHGLARGLDPRGG